LVSLMYVNNETGVIQPISEIGKILQGHQAYFHTDAVQAYGLIDLDVKQHGIDLLSAASHKIHDHRRVGFVYGKGSVAMAPLHVGGEQERKRRPRNENVVHIVGVAKAVELAGRNRTENRRQYKLYKEAFLSELKENGVTSKVNGDVE